MTKPLQYSPNTFIITFFLEKRLMLLSSKHKMPLKYVRETKYTRVAVRTSIPRSAIGRLILLGKSKNFFKVILTIFYLHH